ncbi:hypothetical protein DE146DRAFT_366105 [Phaeosphaeria sp. MPI-PUGE-AT-0046c]|nr:hypothetical protein DE146DRAFT_366105 [Phaeosphaeria sp. MPI-PUGE-AT-0046c]
MAGTPNLHAGLDHTASASRLTAITTSASDEKSAKQDKHKSHRHRHQSSRHEKEHRHSSSRRHAKEVVQSAIQLQPPTSFGDLLKQARGSKDTSPSHSRKGSIAPKVEGEVQQNEPRRIGITIPPRRPLRPEDVEREWKRVEARERDLRAALTLLSDQSLKTSRRLDDTYYAILEKVSVLRQTIGSLQELSGLTKELHENFASDTKELIDDAQGQFDGFDAFDSQQQQVLGLEDRIRSGKKKADSLTDRLAKAKERVDAWAQAETEWEAKNTRRTRIFWGILGCIIVLVLALVMAHHLRPIHSEHDPRPTLDFATRAQVMDADLPDIAKEAIIGSGVDTSKPNVSPTHVVSVSVDDERLRVFDEL